MQEHHSLRNCKLTPEDKVIYLLEKYKLTKRLMKVLRGYEERAVVQK